MIRTRPLFLLLFFMLLANLPGQNAAAVERLLAYEKPSPEQIDSLLKYSTTYLFYNQDTCLLIASEALKRAEKWYPGEATHANALLILADAYNVRSDWAANKAALEKGQGIYRSLGLEDRVAAADMKFGSLYRNTEEYEAALRHEFSALETWLKLKDTNNIFRPYLEIAGVFHALKQPLMAIEYNAEALRWGRLMEHGGIIRVALSNQAELEMGLARDLKRRADTAASAVILMDSMRLYQDKALVSLKEALALTEGNNNRFRLAASLDNMADLLADRGEFAEAYTYSRRSEKLCKALKSDRILLNNQLIRARIHRQAGRADSAVIVGNAALAIPKAEENAATTNLLHEQLYLSYKDLGDLAAAFPHFEAFTNFERDNANAERVKAVTSVEAKFQNASKEKQLLELGLQNETITRQRNYLLMGSLFLAFLGFIAFQFNRIRRDRKNRIDFTQALIDGQEEERKRIARDLHDGIGQSLLIIKKQIEQNNDSTLENRNLITSTLEEVRSISRDLHPVLLEKFGITATIEDIVARVAANEPELFITTDITDIDGSLSPKAELQVFRAVQEALSNIVKHAKATAARVSVKSLPGSVEILVQDNGLGFDYELAKKHSRSLGLRTMKERMASVLAIFSIGPGETSGTVVRMVLPQK